VGQEAKGVRDTHHFFDPPTLARLYLTSSLKAMNEEKAVQKAAGNLGR